MYVLFIFVCSKQGEEGQEMQLVATRCNTRKRIEEMAGVVKAIEVDLMMTQDGHLVVGHPVELQAKNYTLSSLRDFRLKVKNPELLTPYILEICSVGPMTFDKLMQLVIEKDLMLFLDLKYEEMGSLVAKELLKYALTHQDRLRKKLVIISRSQENLVAVSDTSLDLKSGWIFDGALIDPKGDFVRLHNLYFVAPSYCLTPVFLQKFCDVIGLKLCVRACGLTHELDLLKMKKAGVNYLFTDPEYAPLSVEILRNRLMTVQ